ncbi:3,4-dehydroadipyl-CoA semialdehyde dehydrogenase [Myxococcota bacterium]|nr:3,4-dehydroadipyl-CoA semialdehyde dehydrogenase [Myxococcota bacterium]
MTIERIQSYVFGEWRDGSREGATLVNPATEEVIATADSTGIDLGAALDFARTVGGPALRALTFAERAELLQKMSTAIHAEREPLIDSAVANGGCTRSDAKFDIDGAIGTLAHYAELGKALGATRILADGEGIQLGRSPRFWGQHVFVPRTGVAVLINAFNFPAWGFAEKAACAILAGVPVFTKAATATSHTAWRVTDVLVRANVLPKGAMSFLAGSASGIVDHLGAQDLLAFTGSADTAGRLRSHPRLIAESVRVNVEADSLNAAILGPDAELSSDVMTLFLRDVARDMTQKTGQKCTAIRRIFVPEAIVDDVQAELVARLQETRVGDPALKEVNMGPVATRQQLDDVKKGIALLSEDADVVMSHPSDGKFVGVDAGKGYFHPITLLRARDGKTAKWIHQHEVFGPVATLVPYSGDADEVAALVARGNGGLVASVYSDDKKFTESVVLGIAPYHGRIYIGASKVLEHATGPGLVLPSCVHGGPGRAGGGEELGGLRGVEHFMQRVAIQGPRPVVEGVSGTKPKSEG